MSGEAVEQMIDDAITYGIGACHIWQDDGGHIQISKVDNPYSWSIKYFDDWRCVVDYLRDKEV